MRVLSSATWTDRLRILGLIANSASRSMRRGLALPLRTARSFRTSAPERLVIAPQDIRTGDPTIAAELAAGYFAFCGQTAHASRQSIFTLDDHSRAFAMQLHGFGWLRHFRSTADPAVRTKARALVAQFLDAHSRPSAGPAWEPEVAARRMIAWLAQSPVVLEGSDRDFYFRFMAALATTRIFLEHSFSEGLTGEPRLLGAIALAEFGLCAAGDTGFQRKGTALLAEEVAAQVLDDGGHISRDPQCLIDLLLDLLPLRQAYAARGIAVPQPVLNAIDRMMPMLRLFRHGDGTLALFNGMSVTAAELVATILAYDDARGQPLSNAIYSGYQRVDAGTAVLIVEAGKPPPPDFSTRAHAGCLSFELSDGPQRIIVNCGAPELSRAHVREFARNTAAHSTLVIDDTSSAKFATHTRLERWLGDRLLSGPTVVSVERLHGDGFTTLKLAHDGYEARFGYLHARELSLSMSGDLLEGRDALTETRKPSAATLAFALRFHLHPNVHVRIAGENNVAVIDLPSGERWVFQADQRLTIEPSIVFAAHGAPRHTRQIVIAASTDGPKIIHWVLRKRATGSA